MTAELTIQSLYGNGATLTLPSDASGTELQIYLTDLPTPKSYELYINGTLATATTWNSTIAYQQDIPLTGLTAGTYNFSSTVFFSAYPNVATTNTATLTISSPSTFSATTNIATSVSGTTTTESTTPAPTLSLAEKVAIGIGVAGAIGIGAYILTKKKY